jgi:DsbC/DsbD-like thiol-disulfide interchange protein
MKSYLILILFSFIAIQAEQAADSLKVQAEIIHVGKGKVQVKVSIKEGWYIYGPKLKDEFLIPTRLSLPDSSKAELIDVRYPETEVKKMFGKKYPAYTRQVVIEAIIRASKEDDPNILCLLHYQTCNGKMCLPPATLKLSTSVNQKEKP